MPLSLPPQQGFTCPICHGEGTVVVKDEGKREPCPNMTCHNGRVANPNRDGMD